MLIYHEKEGLREIETPTFPAAKVGTYLPYIHFGGNVLLWKLRVKRRTKGATWKQVTTAELPVKMKVEALLLGLTL